MVSVFRALCAILSAGLVFAAAASAQQSCNIDPACCQKGKWNGTCVVAGNRGTPVEELETYRRKMNPYNYITKRIGKTSDPDFLYGLATAKSETILKPACRDGLPVMHDEYYPCLGDGETVTLYHESGRVVTRVTDTVPLDETLYPKAYRKVFIPGRGRTTWHGDALVLRQNAASGPRFVIVNPLTGKQTLTPENAVLLPWIRLIDEDGRGGDGVTRVLENWAVKAGFADARQRLAVPTGESIDFGAPLGVRAVYRPLADDGSLMALPAGVTGVVNVDDQMPTPVGYAVVRDTLDGRRYSLTALDAERAVSEASGLTAYTALSRYDRIDPDMAKRSRSYLAGQLPDGRWEVSEFWAPGTVRGQPGATPEMAWQGDTDRRKAAVQLAAAEKAEAARLERERTEQANRDMQDQYARARTCFITAIAAYQNGRWSEVPKARAYHLMKSEAVEATDGWTAVEAPEDCSAERSPSDESFDFESGSLIQFVPSADVRAAYNALGDDRLKPAFLARWAARDDFPEDIRSSANGWAEGVAFGYTRTGKDWEFAGDILYWLAEHGDERAAFVIARRLSGRFPKYTMRYAAEMGSTEAWDQIRLNAALAADWDAIREKARKRGEAQAALSNAFKAQVAEDQRCREL